MRYFPIFVDLQNRKVLVVGGGEEAVRKVRLILKSTARVEVIAETLHPELQQPRVRWLSKSYDAAYLAGAAMVYCADANLNARVAADSRNLGIPVNAVDQAEISTFIVPCIVDRDPVVIAIGTEGTAPVLAQNIRTKIDVMLPQKTGALASAAAKIRNHVAALVPHGNRRRSFWRSFFEGAPRDAIFSDDNVAYELALGDALFESARPAVGRVSSLVSASEDPEDLTLRSLRMLQEADVIVVEKAAPAAILETARRDAVRLTAVSSAEANSFARIEAAKGHHVVILCSRRDFESGGVTPFPMREDIRDAILKVAS